MDDGAVKLMTLHAAKGLEFDAVFLTGCEQDLLPHSRALEEDPEGGLEEERRLFYVGVTRARRRLTLTRATTRLFFGETRWQVASTFLEELPPDSVEGGEACYEENERAVLGEYEESSDDGLAVGSLVESHRRSVGEAVKGK